jgi:hypothetical protein
MTFFFSDHPLLGIGLAAVVCAHAAVIAWWLKQAIKPVVKGSGNPYLLNKNK